MKKRTRRQTIWVIASNRPNQSAPRLLLNLWKTFVRNHPYSKVRLSESEVNTQSILSTAHSLLGIFRRVLILAGMRQWKAKYDVRICLSFLLMVEIHFFCVVMRSCGSVAKLPWFSPGSGIRGTVLFFRDSALHGETLYKPVTVSCHEHPFGWDCFCCGGIFRNVYANEDCQKNREDIMPINKRTKLEEEKRTKSSYSIQRHQPSLEEGARRRDSLGSFSWNSIKRQHPKPDKEVHPLPTVQYYFSRERWEPFVYVSIVNFVSKVPDVNHSLDDFLIYWCFHRNA